MSLLRPSDEEDRNWEFEAERRSERERQHAPAPGPLPPLPSSMSVLAHTILNGSFHERRDASRVLAQMVLEESESTASPGEGGC